MNSLRVFITAIVVLASASCGDRITAAIPAPHPNPFLEVLSGSASPVRVVRVGPGATVRIRCGSTIAPRHHPLWVVNGHPVTHAELHRLNVDPTTIVSVTIDKGPTAVTRWGSGAANGAVLITLRGP